MDATALSLTAANALVGAITTDAWEKARSSVVALWRSVHPNRAEAIGEELSDSRAEALAARHSGDAGAEQDLVADWQRRLHRLLDAEPRAATQLQHVLDDVLLPALSSVDQQRIGKINLMAKASGHARVYQAGRDMRIVEQ